MQMRYFSTIIVILFLFNTLNTHALSYSISNDLKVSMKDTFNSWEENYPIIAKNYSLDSQNTHWSSNSIKLIGTERLLLNLSANNMEYALTNNSLFKFAWKFQSNQYDYIGFILYTPNNSYYIVSYFGNSYFTNGTNSAIYEFSNEQPNTWYEHEVNLTLLFIENYGFLPEKIDSIVIINAYFGSNGLIPSNQISYFDDFRFINQTTISPSFMNNSTQQIISISNTKSDWQDQNPTGTGNYTFTDQKTYWSNETLELGGTEVIFLNLTANNMEYNLTTNSLFKFAWNFQSKAYDYIGFILYTPNNSYYIVSYFGTTYFANGSTSAIYEFANEQTNTWYEHEVNLTALFLQSYGFLPAKIISIKMINAYFGSGPLTPSNQLSYFDDFAFITNKTTITSGQQMEGQGSVNVSINSTFNEWQDLNQTNHPNYSLSPNNTYWSTDSMNINNTIQLELNLTKQNMEFNFTNSTIFKFAWKFQSTQYDYIGFILDTSQKSYYIISYFGNTYFVNGTKSGIYEISNEQINTWYEHEVNLSALFLQSFGSIPEKINSIIMINAYFGNTGLQPSNQVSYFDDFEIYNSKSNETNQNNLTSILNNSTALMSISKAIQTSEIPLFYIILALPLLYVLRKRNNIE